MSGHARSELSPGGSRVPGGRSSRWVTLDPRHLWPVPLRVLGAVFALAGPLLVWRTGHHHLAAFLEGYGVMTSMIVLGSIVAEGRYKRRQARQAGGPPT